MLSVLFLAATCTAAFQCGKAVSACSLHDARRSSQIVLKAEDLRADELEVALLTEERLLLDVYAVWCGPCQLLAPQMDLLAQVDAVENQLDGVIRSFAGRVRVAKFDSEQEPGGPALASQLDVGALPCLLFITDGEIEHRVEGALPAARIAELVDGVWLGGEMPTGPDYGDFS